MEATYPQLKMEDIVACLMTLMDDIWLVVAAMIKRMYEMTMLMAKLHNSTALTDQIRRVY